MYHNYYSNYLSSDARIYFAGITLRGSATKVAREKKKGNCAR